MGEGNKKNPAESFGDMMKEFGETISRIFDDPELKKKAKDFGESAVSSAKTFGNRFKDEEVKDKFNDFKDAARKFGGSVSEYFKDDEQKVDGEEKTGQENNGGKEEGTAEEEDDDQGELKKEPPKNTRGGRIVGYSMGIVWCSILLVFFNYFYDYIAAYNYDEVMGVWTRTSMLTGGYTQWLPILNAALIAAIIGNIILIAYDRFYFRQIIHMILNLFGLATVISLAVIFPFDFTVFAADTTRILTPIVMTALILIAIGIGIGTIVSFVKFIVGITRSTSDL